MAYDQELAERIHLVLGGEDVHVSERRMFGGLAFMVDGHMAVGVLGDDLMVRVGKDEHEEALAHEHARPMDFTGRSLTGFVYVGPGGISSHEDLATWVRRGIAFVRTLPPRQPSR